MLSRIIAEVKSYFLFIITLTCLNLIPGTVAAIDQNSMSCQQRRTSYLERIGMRDQLVTLMERTIPMARSLSLGIDVFQDHMDTETIILLNRFLFERLNTPVHGASAWPLVYRTLRTRLNQAIAAHRYEGVEIVWHSYQEDSVLIELENLTRFYNTRIAQWPTRQQVQEERCRRRQAVRMNCNENIPTRGLPGPMEQRHDEILFNSRRFFNRDFRTEDELETAIQNRRQHEQQRYQQEWNQTLSRRRVRRGPIGSEEVLKFCARLDLPLDVQHNEFDRGCVTLTYNDLVLERRLSTKDVAIYLVSHFLELVDQALLANGCSNTTSDLPELYDSIILRDRQDLPPSLIVPIR